MADSLIKQWNEVCRVLFISSELPFWKYKILAVFPFAYNIQNFGLHDDSRPEFLNRINFCGTIQKVPCELLRKIRWTGIEHASLPL